MFSAGLAGMSIGPCAAAATFAISGNTWHVQTLQNGVGCDSHSGPVVL